MFYYRNYDSPVGELLLKSDGEYLTGLWIYGQNYFESEENIVISDEDIYFREALNFLDSYFAGEVVDASKLKLKFLGTEFRKKVWQKLLEIPYGETRTYSEIAKSISSEKNLTRAVGGAVAHNPISIIVPCHRVVGFDGNLTGYAGGISNKIKLLRIEGVDTEKFSLPRK